MIKNQNFRRASTASVSAAAILLAAFGGAAIAGTQGADSAPTLSGAMQTGAPFSFADLIEQVSPAVVSIEVEAEVENPFADPDLDLDSLPPGFREFFKEFRRRTPEGEQDETRRARGAGSGFFVSSDGILVTNYHVVADADQITVVMEDGRELDAEVVGLDQPTDLAVLRVEGSDFPHVSFDRDPNLRVGDWVVAMGNPFNLGGTATAGIVSAAGREIGGAYNGFIQIDAPINRGNSGGPLFDISGHVVGVNSQIFSPTGGNIGIGFAIPSTSAADIVDQLVTEGRIARGWLGVTIQSLAEDVPEALGLDDDEGAIVTDVTDDSPADKAGFESGDVVLEVNGEGVESSVDLTRRVGQLKAKDKAKFLVLRDGKQRTINVTIGDRPDPETLAKMAQNGSSPNAAPAEEESNEDVLGVTLSELDAQTRRAIGLDDDVSGAAILDVKGGSEAAEKGLRKGEVILEVNGENVASARDVVNAIDDARADNRSKVLVRVLNPQGRRYIALSINEDDKS